MNTMPAAAGFNVSRRQLMIGAAGLTFAFLAKGAPAYAATPASTVKGKALTPWVSIAADGTISIMAPATEMGQGSGTSLPLIVAEELDADWAKVEIVPAPVVEKLYGNPGFGGMMYTAGSNAVRSYYTPLRTFGAQVRRVLLDNAARHWNVPVAELTTEPSVVVHANSNRRIGYGEIAAFAEAPQVAPEIKPADLKPASRFRLIGKDVLRAELPNKVNGTAQYSIDVQVPGMIYGAVLRSPVEGSAPQSFDDAKVKKVAGVLASAPWAAFDGKAEIERSIKWNRTGKAWGFNSETGMQAFAADARNLS
ncbi:MAG TPA: molybdopterin cofactor-binding domain-containing protein, partial [Pararhizobium sp.]|nr:molybdopterin cofactor-binding domain-containing protein [Pararhizobium sp.]